MDKDELLFSSKDENEDELLFAPEDTEDELLASVTQENEEVERLSPWKLLIVDDEEEIHKITEIVLEDFSFEGRKIEFINAYSGREAKEIIKENNDIALILLDVVMEEDNSGLKVIKYIREELKDNIVRIVLRTGQPGQAPEREVIRDYMINDYKQKTDITAKKLYTTVITALRSYQDLNTIKKSKMGLQKIIESSAALFEPKFLKSSLQEFISAALFQLASLLKMEKSFLYTSGFAAKKAGNSFSILGGTEQYDDSENKAVEEVVSKGTYEKLTKVREKKENGFFGNEYIAYFETNQGTENIIYLKGEHEFSDFDKKLLEIFSTNIVAAFDHILMNNEIVETQKEIVLTLSEVTETRSKETVQHVRRVAEYVYILAVAYGLNEDEAKILKMASPMHDIGKIGIGDSILKKPARLTDEEYEIMKEHTNIGHELLKSSSREILKTAAIIAYQHHEHWNGGGYPQGLAGEDIHIYGRITALADVFDALTHKRVYKDAWELDRVFDLIKEERGAQFDPQIVDIFFENLDQILEIKDQYPDD